MCIPNREMLKQRTKGSAGLAARTQSMLSDKSVCVLWMLEQDEYVRMWMNVRPSSTTTNKKRQRKKEVVDVSRVQRRYNNNKKRFIPQNESIFTCHVHLLYSQPHMSLSTSQLWRILSSKITRPLLFAVELFSLSPITTQCWHDAASLVREPCGN